MDRFGPFLRSQKGQALPGLIELRPGGEENGLSGEIGITPRDLSHLRLLEGISAEKTLSRIGLLFTLCRMAQTTLAREAMGHAESRPLCENDRRNAEWKILKESLLESLRTVLTPPGGSFSSVDPVWKHFRSLSAGMPCENPDTPFWKEFRWVCERSVFGGPSYGFWEMESPEHWDRWAQCGKEEETTPASLFARDLIKEDRIEPFHFPPLTRQKISEFLELILDSLNSDHFLIRPHLGGVFHETGPKARMGSHPLVLSLESANRPLASRLAARLLELAAWAEEGPLMAHKSLLFGITSKSPTSGTGMAWTETARGVLIHQATVRMGQTESYRILAPTEWTFHPEGGPFKRWTGPHPGSPSSRPGKKTVAANGRSPCLDQSLWIFDPCTPVQFVEEEKMGPNTGETMGQ